MNDSEESHYFVGGGVYPRPAEYSGYLALRERDDMDGKFTTDRVGINLAPADFLLLRRTINVDLRTTKEIN